MEDERSRSPDPTRLVVEWTDGLPDPADDLTPLSQPLITPSLASAFRVTPEPNRTILDVHRASHRTVSSIKSTRPRTLDHHHDDEAEEEEEEEEEEGKEYKRARLVWTPQLHKRFVDVVAHVGTENAVPKTIMNLMNVEGLTRENVASHLQKYRLYLKRRQGVLRKEDPFCSPAHFRGQLPAPPPPRRVSGQGTEERRDSDLIGNSGVLPPKDK